MKQRILFFLLIAVLMQLATCKKSPVKTFNLLILYEKELVLSRTAESSARNVTKLSLQHWSSEVARILANYRIKAKELKDLVLKENSDGDDECAKDMPRGVEEATTIYLEGETPCTRTSDIKVGEARKKVKNAIKEIRMWRKDLQFMSRSCREKHAADYVEAVKCLAEQMDSESYDTLIIRLSSAAQEAQSEFLTQIRVLRDDLENCIDESFHIFSESIAAVVENVTLCREERETTDRTKSGGEIAPEEIRRRLRLKCLE